MNLLEIFTEQIEKSFLDFIESEPRFGDELVTKDGDKLWCNCIIHVNEIFKVDLFNIYFEPMTQSMARMVPKNRKSTDKIAMTITNDQPKNVYFFYFETFVRLI